MHSYPTYKDSEVEWIGKIPASWDIKPMFTVVSESKISNKGMIENNLLSLSYGRIIQKDIETLGGLLPESFETYQVVNENDIIFRLTDLQNDKRSLRSAICNERGIITSAYVTVKPQNIRSKFMHYLMRSYDETKVFYNLGSGMRQSLKYDELKRLPVVIPSESEQAIIEKFLDRDTARVDKLIAEKQTFLSLLKEKRQSLISHVVTKGLNPNVRMKDSGIEWIGEVPEHWELKKLKYVGKIQSGIAKGKDNADKEVIDVPMLRVANVQDGYLDLEDVHTIQIEPRELERYSLQYGDVLMNEGGDNDKLGRGAVWRQAISPCIHQNHVFALRMQKIEPEWLEVLTQSSYAKFYFYYHSKQSTNLASISATNIKQTPLVVPPESERKDILNYLNSELSRTNELYSQVLDSIDLLKEHRTALISAAVTGKIDVRNYKEEVV